MPEKTAQQIQAELKSLREQVSKLQSYEAQYNEVKKELQKRDKRFKAVTENLNVGLYRNTIGPKGKFVDANPAVLKIFGFKNREEFLKTDVADLYVDPEERKDISAKLEKDGYLRNEKLQLRKKDGSTFYSSVSAVVVKDESGKPRYFDGIIEDITDRVKAEKALRQSEKKFRNIVESSPMGMHMYELQEDGNLIFSGANPAADKILGVSNAQFIGKTIEEAFPPLAETEVPVRYKSAAAKGEFWKTDQIMYEDDKKSKGPMRSTHFRPLLERWQPCFWISQNVCKQKRLCRRVKKNTVPYLNHFMMSIIELIGRAWLPSSAHL